MIELYSVLVFFHILLFVFWLGADLGVAILGEQFRQREYSIQERLTLLKILVITDMGPRTAWALMIASTISLVAVGGYWAVPFWGILLAWAITPKATRLKKIEMLLKWGLAAFYLSLGSISLTMNTPLEPNWLASKALLFGFIFIAAILIDVMFKPVGPALMELVEKGSSDATEVPLLTIMNRSRVWVRVTYLLLIIVAFIGTTKFF